MDKNTIIEKLKIMVSLIDFKKMNIIQIKSNVDKLFIIYKKIKKIWDSIINLDIKSQIYLKSDSQYKTIKTILFNSFLSENKHINQIITDSKSMQSLKYLNLEFIWIDNIEGNTLNYQMALKMMKIMISMYKLQYINQDNIIRQIIWIPINKERNFYYDTITKNNLKKTEDNFEAFVASGVTFCNNPRITIITRYEEIEKLLIHELIHNYNMDGSDYHNELYPIITQYKSIKNKSNYDYEYSIYESYTELLSTYFYLIFENLLFEIQIEHIKEKLLSQIIIEIIYSYNLICNLSLINGYTNYNDFFNSWAFYSNICKYEYYLIKGLMYHNYDIELGTNINDFKNIYKQIILMIQKIKSEGEPLLQHIYKYQQKITNFKYQIH